MKHLRWVHNGSCVGKQFTEFNNFIHESAVGSIGQLLAYFTLDAYINDDLPLKQLIHMNIFVNSKNLTNQIYGASRLNRATSGIFPGGFRQFIVGVNFSI